MDPASFAKTTKTPRPWEEPTGFESIPKKQRTVNSSYLGQVSMHAEADLSDLFGELQIRKRKRDEKETPRKRQKFNHLSCLDQNIPAPNQLKRKNKTEEVFQKRRKLSHLPQSDQNIPAPNQLKRKNETKEIFQKKQKINHLPYPEQDIHCQKQNDILLNPQFWESLDNPKSKIILAQRLIEKNFQESLKMAYDILIPTVEKTLEEVKKDDELVYFYFQFLVFTKGFPYSVLEASPAVIKAILNARYSGSDACLKLLFAIYREEISPTMTFQQFFDHFYKNEDIILSALSDTPFKDLSQNVLKTVTNQNIKHI